jgi:hypothetical protein
LLYSTLAEKRTYFRVVMDLFQDLMMMKEDEMDFEVGLHASH